MPMSIAAMAWLVASTAATMTPPFGDTAFGVASQGDVMIEWAQQLGAKTSLRIVQQSGLGHGLEFTKAVQPNDIVLSIPFAVAMTVHSAKQAKGYGDALQDLERRGAAPLLLLALHLLKVLLLLIHLFLTTACTTGEGAGTQFQLGSESLANDLLKQKGI